MTDMITNDVVHYMVVGEDGGSIRLTGEPGPTLIGGAETRMRQQGRRGYVVQVTGNVKDGKFTVLSPVNEPSVPFEEVADKFRVRSGGRPNRPSGFGGMRG